MSKPAVPREVAENLAPLQVVTLCLSVYVLVILLLQSVFQFSPEAEMLLEWVDVLVCGVFLAEFCVRFRRAPSKLAFMRWGWIDLISSIPTVGWLRAARFVRLIRILRILRALRSARGLIVYLFNRRKGSSVVTVATIAFIVVVFAAIAILQFEDAPKSNIKTPIDALWWAFATVTTVGYGDHYPVTVEGRFVAVLLMTAGIGLFGTFTGLVASLFVAPDIKEENEDVLRLIAEVRALREELAVLKRLAPNAPAPAAGESAEQA